MQLERSRTDFCIYFKREGKQRFILGIYVVDIIILSKNGELLRSTKQKLAEKFKTKDLVEAQHLLGLKVSRNEKRDTIWLDQENHVEEILRKFSMENSKLVYTPEDPNQKLLKEQCLSSNAEREEMKKISERL